MKTLLSHALVVSAVLANGFAMAEGNGHLFTTINVSNRRPVKLSDSRSLKAYASQNSYAVDLGIHLHEGMKVSFSTSYGIGGEAAQASGTLVSRDGKFLFKQTSNPSGNLLLPPGLPFNSDTDVSMWDIGNYLALVNRVVFSEPNAASFTATDVYETPSAYLCDFEGGTANETVTYQDALEVNYEKSVGDRSSSKLKVYYSKGIGPVALEFREDMEPEGTFKFYLGK